MTNEERAEAAAKAMVKLGASRRAAGKQMPTRIEEARAALLAAYPELHTWTGRPPTHWLAPWEATVPIAKAIREVVANPVPAPGHHAWEAARTAHLAIPQG